MFRTRSEHLPNNSVRSERVSRRGKGVRERERESCSEHCCSLHRARYNSLTEEAGHLRFRCGVHYVYTSTDSRTLLPPNTAVTTSCRRYDESPWFTLAWRVIKQCRTVVNTSPALVLTMYTLLSASPQTTMYPTRDNTVQCTYWRLGSTVVMRTFPAYAGSNLQARLNTFCLVLFIFIHFEMPTSSSIVWVK